VSLDVDVEFLSLRIRTQTESLTDDSLAMTFNTEDSSPSDLSLVAPSRTMTARERRERRQKQAKNGGNKAACNNQDGDDEDGRFAQLLSKNEDELLKFVAQINKVYQEKLKKPAPFMTFVFCGTQSAGKSTIMERFMNAVLNIVQEGTGTRCPLDTTCIHDEALTAPLCELYGDELDMGGEEGLTVDQVFERIVAHNKKFGHKDRFSTEPLRLVYRASNVQNMRFVDTPGIIANKSTGKDNREDIKKILSSEMEKPNTKLCVLLEPKEFATNPIVDFCDETLGDRAVWIKNATFLMTKYDKNLEDSRTGSKANNFFKEFHKNKCFPHLVITPTLPKEDLPFEELYKQRLKLLSEADQHERDRFSAWTKAHASFREVHEDDDMLNAKIQNKIGFPTAKKKMREIMLEDTAKRLPVVIAELRGELDRCIKERATLKEQQRFTNPMELKLIVSEMLWNIQERILSYLDGDLGSSISFPEKLQTLAEEIDGEEDSNWSGRKLNFHSDKEDRWRDQIALMGGDYPVEIQADKKFLGGKQVQRAIEFFRVVMIESLPNPYRLDEKVANITGYLGGGLQRENWEHAMVQITEVLMKEVSHPGINYLVKHIGSIIRRLFSLALEDIKEGDELSHTFRMVPPAVERHLVAKFEVMLWDLLQNAADKIHCALEPMYSTIDPALPTFHASDLRESDGTQERFVKSGNGYVPIKSEKEQAKDNWTESIMRRLAAITTGSGDKAKEFLKTENRTRAQSKKTFLPDERTSMITDEETQMILRRSFEYIVALMEFNLVNFRFQVNHYLYLGFKRELSKTFMRKGSEADWATLIQADPGVADRLDVLAEQIESLEESLQEVQHMSQRF
jgi:hypothetical protein